MDIIRRGKCINFGQCSKADRKEIIELGFTEDFVCPECNNDLIEDEKKKGLPIKPILLAILVIALLGGLGFGALKLFSGGKKAPDTVSSGAPADSISQPVGKVPCSADPAMVAVEGGTFTMGCTVEQSDCINNETRHEVTVSSFCIGKYEVTQAQWVDVMGNNPSNFKKGDNYPVENVSWNDVQEFISRLNAKTGKQYRLPTEAEWEFAARGGNSSKGYQYSGGNNLNDVAWFNGNSSNSTQPVGTKLPNELGIYDMSGNVWEWCSDWLGDYGRNAQNNPKGPSSGKFRVQRGGSWNHATTYSRVAYRGDFTPTDRNNIRGFRLVMSD